MADCLSARQGLPRNGNAFRDVRPANSHQIRVLPTVWQNLTQQPVGAGFADPML